MASLTELLLEQKTPQLGQTSNPSAQASHAAAPQAWSHNPALEIVIVIALFAGGIYGIHLLERIYKKAK